MSAKILMGLSEENPELKKQIGCMTGIFQVFDKHHLLTGRRFTHERLPNSGHSPVSSSKEEHIPSSPKIVLEYNPTKCSKENRRASFESSPSRSSSYASPSNLKILEVESKTTRSDFRDVVKDSINVETLGLSVKTSVKNEVKKNGNIFSYKDSPRPVLSVDLNDSFRVLVKLKEQPLNTFEAPRFSCDGQEISRSKSSTKLRDVPRLSLDSRENISKPTEMDRNSLHQRVPSIVAKLMGIEEMPNSTSQAQTELVKTNAKKSDDAMGGDGEKDQILHSLKVSLGGASDTRKVKNTSPKQNESVFSQIERRVKELEFSQSNKDLRALKHIVDTMQTKGKHEPSQKNQNLKSVSSESQRITTPRPFESPIVIMKPAKSIEKSRDQEGLSGRKKATDRAHKSRSNDTSSEKRTEVSTQKTQTPALPWSPRPIKPSDSSSLRVQQRKLDSEKKPLPSASRQNGRVRTKPSKIQQRNNEISKREDNNISLAMSDDFPVVMNSPSYPQNMLEIQDEDSSRLDYAMVSVEQPSPISVLDSPFYRDDMPLSPVKKISFKIEEYDLQNTSDEITTSKLSSAIFTQKLNKIKDLAQKLRQLSSTDDDFLSQILIASNFGSIQEITCGSKANSERLHQTLMFDVIEEILARKLESMSHGRQPFIFIQVRKISGQLLLKLVCSEIKQLLAERLSSDSLEDDDLLFCEDLMKGSDGWNDFGIEVPGLVLEIERLIFKDLIDEIVTAVADYGTQVKANRRRRQLIFNL